MTYLSKSHSLIQLFYKLLHNHILHGLLPHDPHVDQPAGEHDNLRRVDSRYSIPGYFTQSHHQAHGAKDREQGHLIHPRVGCLKKISIRT